MTGKKTMEDLNRELREEYYNEQFEENFVKNIVSLAMESGWSIDHIMKMGIKRFYSINEIRNKINDDQEKRLNTEKDRLTIR